MQVYLWLFLYYKVKIKNCYTVFSKIFQYFPFFITHSLHCLVLPSSCSISVLQLILCGLCGCQPSFVIRFKHTLSSLFRLYLLIFCSIWPAQYWHHPLFLTCFFSSVFIYLPNCCFHYSIWLSQLTSILPVHVLQLLSWNPFTFILHFGNPWTSLTCSTLGAISNTILVKDITSLPPNP